MTTCLRCCESSALDDDAPQVPAKQLLCFAYKVHKNTNPEHSDVVTAVLKAEKAIAAKIKPGIVCVLGFTTAKRAANGHSIWVLMALCFDSLELMENERGVYEASLDHLLALGATRETVLHTACQEVDLEKVIRGNSIRLSHYQAKPNCYDEFSAFYNLMLNDCISALERGSSLGHVIGQLVPSSFISFVAFRDEISRASFNRMGEPKKTGVKTVKLKHGGAAPISRNKSRGDMARSSAEKLFDSAVDVRIECKLTYKQPVESKSRWFMGGMMTPKSSQAAPDDVPAAYVEEPTKNWFRSPGVTSQATQGEVELEEVYVDHSEM